MRKYLSVVNKAFAICFVVLFIVGCSPVNTVEDKHFDKDGCFILDSLAADFFSPKQPSKVKFYVEVSGSMNGFFRKDMPTDFKTDLWEILSYYSEIAPEVCVLTNDGSQCNKMNQERFNILMNTGAFVSEESTKVPEMLQTIIENLDAEAGEVAVLVSDMKYSPVGDAAPAVKMAQYSTNISKILGKYGKAVSLICATSNYLNKSGNIITTVSPYYYLIIGNSEQVAEMRNSISALLEHQGRFVDNIESGFNYGRPKHSFGIPNKCEQLDEEPTFVAYEDEEPGDTCTIQLKVNLENYRWITSDEQVFRKAFTIKALYGSLVKVGDIKIETKNVNKDKELKRESTAIVDIKICNMALESEVLEWTLKLPDTDYTMFSVFFDNANNEDDPTKSFSVLDFVKGMFYGGVVNESLEPNYILISKNR